MNISVKPFAGVQWLVALCLANQNAANASRSTGLKDKHLNQEELCGGITRSIIAADFCIASISVKVFARQVTPARTVVKSLADRFVPMRSANFLAQNLAHLANLLVLGMYAKCSVSTTLIFSSEIRRCPHLGDCPVPCGSVSHPWLTLHQLTKS